MYQLGIVLLGPAYGPLFREATGTLGASPETARGESNDGDWQG